MAAKERNNPLLDYQLIEDDDRPSTLVECLDDDGEIIQEKYALFKQKEEELDEAQDRIDRSMYKRKKNPDDDDLPRQKKTRSPRKHKSLKPFYIADDGEIVHLQPRQTFWYLVYVKSAQQNLEKAPAKFAKKFRRRFRMPFEEYHNNLLPKVQADAMFSRWKSRDATGQQASPIELLLLGALRYLGRGLTFDDLEEYTAINEETHRQFFHVFINWGSSKLFPMYVKMPTTAAEYDNAEYNAGGLTGAGFSTDATNVVMWRCSQGVKQVNMGFKQSHPARTYNLSCNHRRKILYTTSGHPSRWNDKTLAHVDLFMSGIHEGRILQDVEFELLSWMGRVGKSGVARTKYRGAWGLVDNGYHKWACTQAPAKSHLMRAEERLSEWIESFRKDAECTFGILKGRFRILQTGIRLEGTEPADKIWLTCCALHNLLLEADGLSEPWDAHLGKNDVSECRRHAPFAIRRLKDCEIAGFGTRQHERQAIAEASRDRAVNIQRRGQLDDEDDSSFVQDDDDHLQEEAPVVSEDGAIFVNSLTYDDFRSRLVEHFDILHRKKQIVWPERKKPVAK